VAAGRQQDGEGNSSVYSPIDLLVLKAVKRKPSVIGLACLLFAIVLTVSASVAAA
jgi:hypothetical protein